MSAAEAKALMSTVTEEDDGEKVTITFTAGDEVDSLADVGLPPSKKSFGSKFKAVMGKVSGVAKAVTTKVSPSSKKVAGTVTKEDDDSGSSSSFSSSSSSSSSSTVPEPCHTPSSDSSDQEQVASTKESKASEETDTPSEGMVKKLLSSFTAMESEQGKMTKKKKNHSKKKKTTDQYDGFNVTHVPRRDHTGNTIIVDTLNITSPHIRNVLRRLMPSVRVFFNDVVSFSPPSYILMYQYEIQNWEERYLELIEQEKKEKAESKLSVATGEIEMESDGDEDDEPQQFIPTHAYDYDDCDDYDYSYAYGQSSAQPQTAPKEPFSMEKARVQMHELITYFRENNESSIRRFERLLRSGQIDCDSLGRYLQIGRRYMFANMDTYQIGILQSKVFNSYNWVLTYLMVQYDHAKRRFVKTTKTFQYPAFHGNQSLSSLTFHPYRERQVEKYQARGQRYCELVKGHSHLFYSNFMYNIHRPYSDYPPMKLRSHSRVVVDDSNSINAQRQPNHHRSANNSQMMKEVPADLLDLCPPYVFGMDLNTKEWGSFLVSELREIKYRDEAFDYLRLNRKIIVPDEETGKMHKMTQKEFVRTLVTNHHKITFEDLAVDKSSGLIFLLYGPPGNGKTFTAEATSEVLHLPLYKLSVGELGTTARDVEQTLRLVLDNVRRWKAVLLIDEVDIFLERRTQKTDIMKNAIVGVFLRCLEYHNGIIFMTSNRIESMDDAFDSRIHQKIEYPPLSLEDKYVIFRDLLGRHGVAENREEIMEMLTKYPQLNGRNLKYALHKAQCLAASKTVSYVLVKASLQMMETNGRGVEAESDDEDTTTVDLLSAVAPAAPKPTIPQIFSGGL